MSERNKEARQVKLWTPLRLVSTVIVLGLFAAFGVSSCNSNDPPSAPNQRLTARVAPAANRAAPALVSLPRLVLDAENKAATGAPIKLSNYSGKVLLVN